MIRAEDVYTALLKDDAPRVAPGAGGTFTCSIAGRELSAAWEVRPNSLWTRGRVFLRCPRCGLRRTRLYLPLETSWLACRTCWGLTYASRTLYNYKDSLWGSPRFAALFKTTQRDYAFHQTDQIRLERSERSRERCKLRRRYLRRRSVVARR